MTGRIFVDTNVLVYARDASEAVKQRRAAEWLASLWRQRAGGLSIQVLQEYYVTVTSKLSPGLARGTARSDVRDYLAWKPLVIDGPILEKAWALQDRHAIAWWDATIVAAAAAGGFTAVLTEDLQDGQIIAGIRIVNPFRHVPAEHLE